MSYAIKVRTQYKDLLKEVSHIDGTSRMQIVHKGQNQLFHKLIKTFGEKTNIYCLLNTSLNVMGEPIVETIDDAIRFFKNTPVDSLYIGNFKITRKLNMVKK
jgi:carbamoyltransferase